MHATLQLEMAIATPQYCELKRGVFHASIIMNEQAPTSILIPKRRMHISVHGTPTNGINKRVHTFTATSTQTPRTEAKGTHYLLMVLKNE